MHLLGIAAIIFVVVYTLGARGTLVLMLAGVGVFALLLFGRPKDQDTVPLHTMTPAECKNMDDFRLLGPEANLYRFGCPEIPWKEACKLWHPPRHAQEAEMRRKECPA